MTAYDRMGRTISVSDGTTISYTYDAAGRRLTETILGERQIEYTYNQAGLLTGMQNTVSDMAEDGSNPAYTAFYGYNTDGTQRSKLDTYSTVGYYYDACGRLYMEQGEETITYSYDACGNRTAMTKGSVTTTYTYNKANQLLTETSQGVTKNYTYDNAGNLTTVTSGISTLKTYTYDAWGRQTGYSEPLNLVTATYTYGPDNLRRSKTVGSNTTSYVWSGSNMVYEATGSSGTVYRYGATIFASDDGTATYTYLLNGHGDVVQMLVGTTVVKSYKYDAFGNEIGMNSADTNPFRYCAQYYDKESGTIYLRARYYAPGQGRFTQQDDWTFADPNNSSSLNLYIYCWNDPNQYYDPSGHSGLGLALLIGVMLLFTGCSQVTYSQASDEEVEAYVQNMYMLFPYESFESIEDAAWRAADYLFTNEILSEKITTAEYQINIIQRIDTGKFYVTKPYTDNLRDTVYYRENATPNEYVTVATLHTHDHIKEDEDSVFSKDKNNLPEYIKYVLEVEGNDGRLVMYNRKLNKTEVIAHFKKNNP